MATVPDLADDTSAPVGWEGTKVLRSSTGGRPLRVLSVIDQYPPVIGGLERHVQTLSRELARRGHSVAVATLEHAGEPTRDLDEEVRVYRLRSSTRFLKRFYDHPDERQVPPLPDPELIAQLDRVLKAERPDIVHARSWMLYSYLALRPRPRPKLVVSLHDYFLVCPKQDYLHAGSACDGPGLAKCSKCAAESYGWPKSVVMSGALRGVRPLNGRIDRFIAISRYVREASLPAVRGVPVDVVPTFVPDHVLAGGAGRPRPDFLPAEDGYILYVGTLSRYKGLDVLYDAYRRMTGPRPPLVVIGSLRADDALTPPEGTIVARAVPHADVMAAWEHSAMGVVPSRWPEPFGQVAVEAMACGKPVIASATGGLQDVVGDDDRGVLVAPGDVPQLAAAMRRLLDDPALRDRMGAAGRQAAPQFTVSSVAGRVESIYRELVGA